MPDRKHYYTIVIVVLSLFITVLHFLVFEQQAPYVVLDELYYIPLLFGALMSGMKGAILSYLIVSVAYVPFFHRGWTTGFLGIVDSGLHLLFSGFFAFLDGFFIERWKRQQKELEKNRYLSNLGQIAATIVHDLKNPLITILGFARRIQEGKGVALIVDAPDIPITLEIDSFTLQRALVNIISNAIEASDKGQDVEIAAATRKQSMAITIRDHGAGMDRETLDNIFVPFYSRKSSGTGLGMAIVKKIIDGHRGRILIESQPGKGTKVTVEMPY